MRPGKLHPSGGMGDAICGAANGTVVQTQTDRQPFNVLECERRRLELYFVYTPSGVTAGVASVANRVYTLHPTYPTL